MIGRYLDGLTDEQRDRVIQAQEWTHDTFFGFQGERCLVGHVRDLREGFLNAVLHDALEMSRAGRFDHLCEHVGRVRAVELVKARARRPLLTTADVPSPALSSTPQHHAVDV